MQLLRSLFFLFNLAVLINALALPASFDAAFESSKELFKRKGGGGGGGRGGSSGGSSSSSGSSRGGSSSSSSSSSGSSRSGLTSTSSNVGGSTRAGSGPPRGYGGGAYYGGGAAVPYRPNTRSPGGVAPFFIGGAALGVLPGLWLYGAYAYSYPGYYPYYNRTSNQNESHPVECLCGRFNPCGCDVKNETDYLNDVANNNTISRVGDVNGTQTLVINGTLPNGTTAPGGEGAAVGLKAGLRETTGMWVVVAGVVYTMWFM